MIIAIGMIVIFLILFYRYRKIDTTKYNPTSKVLIPFYKLSIVIVEKFINKKSRWSKNIFLKPQVVDGLKQINPTDRTHMHIKKYYVEKIAFSLCILFVFSLLTVLVITQQGKESFLIEKKYIERGGYTDGKISRDLEVSVKDKVENQDIKINITQQKLAEEEVFKLFSEIEQQINDVILGKNTSLMEIRSNLTLPKKMGDNPVQISWDTDSFDVVSSEGEIKNEDLPKEGVDVTITAILQYEDYKEEYNIKVKVLPPILSDAQVLLKQIQSYIQEVNQNERANKYLELPSKIDGKEVTWNEPVKNIGRSVFLLGALTAIAIYYAKDKELEKKVKKREQQLLIDYPDIVSKLTLLLGAGMTVQGAWEKVALDYREKKSLSKEYYRYGYEEMLITYYEIKSGTSEMKAYEDFGRRTKNQRYLKLSSLITQNLRKGSKGLSKILESESLDAFEDRKAYAKTVGEEAGTKLMMPMFLNLILVLIIIMIPACMSFQM